jgi:hypothetical protein
MSEHALLCECDECLHGGEQMKRCTQCWRMRRDEWFISASGREVRACKQCRRRYRPVAFRAHGQMAATVGRIAQGGAGRLIAAADLRRKS